MAVLSVLEILLNADAKGALKGFAQAETATAGFSKSTQTAGAGFTSTFGSAIPLAASAAAVGVVAFGAKAISAASDLNEQLNKSKVVFGDASQSVIAFSETAAEGFGLSQSAALEATGGFGSMLDAAGLTEQAMGKMSTSLVKLGADLGSFNNIPVAEALEKLRSGLAGEAEPLRVLGVFLSENAVKAEAYASGIAKTGVELTEAQKIQARYNLIMKQTEKAQGDFARTVGTSLPNQLKVLQAELEDVAASIGKDLLPVAVNLLTTLRDIIGIVKALGGPIGDTKSSAEQLGGTLGKLGSEEAATATKGLIDFNGVVEQSSQSLDRQQTSVFQTTKSYTDMDGKVHTLLNTYERLSDGGTRLVSSIETTGKVMEETTRKAHHFGDEFSGVGNDIADALKEDFPSIIGTVTRYKDVFTLSPNELVKITQSWVEIGRKMARDLREIAESDLTPAMKQAIAALPPEMRAAWADGNEKQKESIQKAVKNAYDLEETINQLANQARSGFKQVGAAMMDGTRLGITTRSETIAVAAAQAVHNAIERAKDAAGAHSPSEVMAELGRDLMRGLENGIQEADKRIAQKMIDILHNAFDKVKSQAETFRSSIKGAFGGFLDITGAFQPDEEGILPDIGAVLAEQLGAAQQFAQVLNALQRQGASKALISQIASAGPEALGFAQALLQGGPELVQSADATLHEIEKLSGRVADNLTNQFFGQKMDQLRLDLQAARGVDGDVVFQIDGDVFARISRNQLLKLRGSRGGTLGLA